MTGLREAPGSPGVEPTLRLSAAELAAGARPEAPQAVTLAA